jgi:hypothetical protein
VLIKADEPCKSLLWLEVGIGNAAFEQFVE